MALYVVRAKPFRDRLGSLRKELDSGEILRMTPFGEELHQSLLDARIDSKKDEEGDGGDGYAYWVEEDYIVHLLWQWKDGASLTGISRR